MKTKIYTFFSESHKDLLNDYFIRSFERTKMNEYFSLDITRVPQQSVSGDFGSPGFAECMQDKIKVILRAIDENEGGMFIFADCDIQFLKPLHEDIFSYDMTNMDILAQSDQGTICAGFMICKVSEKLKDFFRYIHDVCLNFPNDQICIDRNKHKINYSLLPCDKYYTVGNYTDGAVWNGKDSIPQPPKEVIMHHANFTVGVENKKKLMDMCYNEINKT